MKRPKKDKDHHKIALDSIGRMFKTEKMGPNNQNPENVTTKNQYTYQ